MLTDALIWQSAFWWCRLKQKRFCLGKETLRPLLESHQKVGFSESGISLIWSSGFGILKYNRTRFGIESMRASRMPKITLGIAQNFDSGLRDWRTYWDPPHERKPVGMKSLIPNEYLILNGVNVMSVGRCKRFELVSWLKAASCRNCFKRIAVKNWCLGTKCSTKEEGMVRNSYPINDGINCLSQWLHSSVGRASRR